MNKEKKFLIDNLTKNLVLMVMEDFNYSITEAMDAVYNSQLYEKILDLETGLLTAANGGHEYPIIKKPDGHFEIYKDKHGTVLGMFDVFLYSEYQIQLEKGTKIFVYTDGVPECNGFNGQFKLNRAVETLNKYEDKAPEDICKSMLKELKEFMGNKDQFDDITMVCVEYRGLE